ncbi:hypothetical protein EVAR_31297_1 [Eumeta japonica]|uniref:Uncharacterized protein n=1 Tax=Eumeta variegata TaxID=151549 RepID=A0A4C1VS38_EUMVA|nr:hypothetical protein EVAR_31297_1 [Eumeta japonica]
MTSHSNPLRGDPEKFTAKARHGPTRALSLPKSARGKELLSINKSTTVSSICSPSRDDSREMARLIGVKNLSICLPSFS